MKSTLKARQTEQQPCQLFDCHDHHLECMSFCFILWVPSICFLPICQELFLSRTTTARDAPLLQEQGKPVGEWADRTAMRLALPPGAGQPARNTGMAPRRPRAPFRRRPPALPEEGSLRARPVPGRTGRRPARAGEPHWRPGSRSPTDDIPPPMPAQCSWANTPWTWPAGSSSQSGLPSNVRGCMGRTVHRPGLDLPLPGMTRKYLAANSEDCA